MTDRQIVELFSADEKADERIELPGADRPSSKEEERALLFGFGQMVGMSEADLEAAWREKYPEG